LNGQSFLKKEFPIAVRSYFVPALQKAYGLVNACQNDNAWLNWPQKENALGNDALGILRKIAAEYAIVQAIEENQLPVKYNILPNVSHNASHVELITDNCRATINQVESKKSLPRPAVYRQMLLPSDQGRLFDHDPEFNDSSKPIYVILSHKSNGHFLYSAILGIPDPNQRRWASEPINLLKEPRRVDPIPTEVIRSEGSLVEFNKFIEDVLKNDKKEEPEQ